MKIKAGRLEDARTQLERTPEEYFTLAERLGLFCLIDAAEKNRDSDQLKELIENARDPGAYHSHSYLYMAYAILGEKEAAFAVLENVFKHNSSILLLSCSDPLAENITKTTQYQKYFQKLYPKLKAEKAAIKTKPNAPDEATVQNYLEQLNEFVKEEKPFLNSSLTLRLLADQVAIHPNQLSWLLNERVGKNFNEYINHKRIEHFKKLVVDPANSHISLIGLAYESGFNSKTVFNTTFKKETGMTPKEYQKQYS